MQINHLRYLPGYFKPHDRSFFKEASAKTKFNVNLYLGELMLQCCSCSRRKHMVDMNEGCSGTLPCIKKPHRQDGAGCTPYNRITLYTMPNGIHYLECSECEMVTTLRKPHKYVLQCACWLKWKDQMNDLTTEESTMEDSEDSEDSVEYQTQPPTPDQWDIDLPQDPPYSPPSPPYCPDDPPYGSSASCSFFPPSSPTYK